MLRDDVELLSGHICDGPLTPLFYLLLRDSRDMPKLCRDLGISVPATEQKEDDARGCLASGGLSLEEWLSRNAKPF